MEAKLGYNPSFVWRSLLDGRELLDTRLIWCIGNGKTVRIWQDPWIPKPPSHKILLPMRILDTQATISNLLQEN